MKTKLFSLMALVALPIATAQASNNSKLFNAYWSCEHSLEDLVFNPSEKIHGSGWYHLPGGDPNLLVYAQTSGNDPMLTIVGSHGILEYHFGRFKQEGSQEIALKLHDGSGVVASFNVVNIDGTRRIDNDGMFEVRRFEPGEGDNGNIEYHDLSRKRPVRFNPDSSVFAKYVKDAVSSLPRRFHAEAANSVRDKNQTNDQKEQNIKDVESDYGDVLIACEDTRMTNAGGDSIVDRARHAIERTQDELIAKLHGGRAMQEKNHGLYIGTPTRW